MTPDDRADVLEELAEENEERADEILAEIPRRRARRPSGCSRTTRTRPAG
jgi:hypothetical protein